MSLPAVLRAMKKPKKMIKIRQQDKRAADRTEGFDGILRNSDRRTDGANDLIGHVNTIFEQAKEMYNEAETINSPLLNVTNGNRYYVIPSTPCYSESSFEHLARYPANVPRREDRTFVIILASLIFFVQMFSRDIWIPLFEPALIAFPKWSQTSLALFLIWNTVVGVFLMSPACIIINKYGIKNSILCSCVASTLGTCMRCLPFIDDSTFVVHVSTVFLSSASVFVKPLTVTICTCCFRTGERNLATGIMISASLAGTAAGLLVTIVLREPSFSLAVPSTSAEWKTVVMCTMYACFAMNVVCTLLVATSFPRESESWERYESSATTRKFVPSAMCLLHTVVDNSNLLYVVLSYACSNAFSWPWYQLIDVTYSRMGMPRRVGADCRLWMIVHTCTITLSVCWMADRFTGFNKRFGMVILSLSSACLLWIVWTLNIRHLHGKFPTDLVIGVMFAFPLCWSAQSLLCELATEHAYPLPGNVAVSIAETLKISCECFVYLLMAVFPKFHTYWLHVFTFVAGCSSVAFLVLLKTGKKR